MLEVQDVDTYKASMSSDPPQLIIDVYGTRGVEAASKPAVKKVVGAPRRGGRFRTRTDGSRPSEPGRAR